MTSNSSAPESEHDGELGRVALADERVRRAAQIAEFVAGMSATEQQLFEQQRLTAGASLRSVDHTPLAQLLSATQAALALGSEISARHRRHLHILRPTQAVACHEGCHWCCHLKVSVSAAEVLALADFIEQRLPARERERIAQRAAELARDPRIFSEYAKPEAKIPCALLNEAGACAAYEARPLACRGWSSTDADACRRALDDDSVPVPLNQDWARECAAVALGLGSALTAAGFAGELLELTAALDITLHTPHALARWLAGEAIFAAASASSA